MLVAVVVCLFVFGAAIWSVLDQPVAGHPRRNAVASRVLLAVSGLAVLGGVIAALTTGW